MTTTRNSIWRWMPLILALLVGALLAGGIYLARDDNRDALPSTLIGRKAPDFKLPDLHRPDKFYTPRDFAGAPYLLNVWGSWCAPCRSEAPALVAASQKLADQAVFVGLNTRDFDKAAPRAFVRAFEVPYVNLFDPEGALLLNFSGELPPNAIPSTIVVDLEGRVAARIIGETTESTLVGLIQDVAAGK